MKKPIFIKALLLLLLFNFTHQNSFAYTVSTAETHSGGTFSCTNLDVTSTGFLYITSGCIFTCNTGNITIHSGGQIVIDLGATFVAHGDITIESGAILYTKAGGAPATITQDHNIVINGNLTLTGSAVLNFTGTEIDVKPGGIFNVNNSSTVNMNNVFSFIDVRANYALTAPDKNIPGGRLYAQGGATIQGGDDAAYTPSGVGFLGINVWGGTGGIWPPSQIDGSPVGGTTTIYLNQGDPRCAKAVLDHASVLYAKTALANCAFEGEGYTGLGHNHPVWCCTTAPDYLEDPDGVATAGGIIQASNCHFDGDWKAFVFNPHTNTNGVTPPTTTAEQSFIRECTFDCHDRSYALPAIGGCCSAVQPGELDYVWLKGIYGLNITGCTMNDGAGGGAYHHLRDPAIYALNSCIYVDRAYHFPSTPYTNFTTENLDKFIYVGSSIGNALGSIVNNTNQSRGYGYGIFMVNNNYNEIIRNTIQLYPHYLLSAPYAYSYNNAGIVEENSTGYTIWENFVDKYNANDDPKISGGIIINSSGPGDNAVYKNTVETMFSVGIQANNQNYNPGLGDGDHGLQIICNDISTAPKNYAHDIQISNLSPGGTKGTIAGIAGSQGRYDPSLGLHTNAANKFYQTPGSATPDKVAPAMNLWVIDPFGITSNPLTYFWYSNTPPIEDYPYAYSTVSTLLVNHTGYQDGCPSYVGSVVPFYWWPLGSPTETGYNVDAYNSTRMSLEILITGSGGNPDLQNYYLRQYAMLTDTMIKKYLYEFRDTMTKYRGDSIFRTYKIDTFFNEVTQTYSYDTVIAGYTDSLNIHYHPDSLATILDSAKYFYNYKIMRARLYASQDDYSNAINLLNSIPSNYSLTSAEVKDLNNIIYLFGIEDSLKKHNNNWDSLGSSDSSAIFSIAIDSSGMARYFAQGLITVYNGAEFGPDLYIDSTNDSTQVLKKRYQQSTPGQSFVIISPNPVHDIVNISLQNYAGDMKAEVFDIKGSLLLQAPLISNSTTTIDLSKLLPGNYIIQVFKNEEMIKTQKIVKNN